MSKENNVTTNVTTNFTANITEQFKIKSHDNNLICLLCKQTFGISIFDHKCNERIDTKYLKIS